MAEEKVNYIDWAFYLVSSVIHLLLYFLGMLLCFIVLQFFIAIFLEDSGRYDKPSPIFQRILKKSLDAPE